MADMRAMGLRTLVRPTDIMDLESITDPLVTGSDPGAAGYTPSPHTLDSAHHTGTIGNTQAPQFAYVEGSGTDRSAYNANRMTAGLAHVLPNVTDTYDIGDPTKWWRSQYVSQINAAVFAENVIQLLGGWFIVGHAQGTLQSAVATGSATADFGTAMTPNDFVLIKSHDTGSAVKTEYMQVGTLVSGTTYNVTRDVAAAHGTDPAWAEGTPWLNLGYTGDGRIEFNAYDTPRMQMFTQGATYNAQTEVLRVGDLNAGWDYVAETYGIAIGEHASAKANVTLDATNGLRMRSYQTTKLQLQPDGDVFIGTNIAAAATTQLAIFTNAQTYNSESVDVGDLLIGDNSASKANMFWDKSAGKFQFRGGTTMQCEIGTDGKLLAGGGQLTLDSVGITFAKYTTTRTTTTAHFGDLGTANVQNAQLYLYEYGAGIPALETQIQQWSSTPGTAAGYSRLEQFGLGTAATSVAFSFYGSYNGSGANTLTEILFNGGLNVYGGLNVGTATGAATGEVKASGNVITTGSIYVGNTSGDANNVIWLGANTNNLYLIAASNAGAAIGTGIIFRTHTAAGGSSNDRVKINSEGEVEIGTTFDNTKMTIGLTINQGANNDEILALKSSDVAHGITDYAETNTYANWIKASTTLGGVAFRGFTEDTVALMLQGYGVTDNTTKTTAGRAYVEVEAFKKSGTGRADPGADANLFVVKQGTTTRFIWDSEGSAHADVEWIAFDEHDDVGVLSKLENAMLAWQDPVKRSFVDFLGQHQADLETLEIVHFDRENPGHAMVNTTRLSMLLVGAARQQAGKLAEAQRRIAALESRLLPAG